MSNELENHEDLAALKRRGFSLSIINAHLVVNDIPYLDETGKLHRGKLAAPLHQPTPETVGKPFNHQMFWSGSYPCFLDGKEIPLGKSAANLDLAGTKYDRHFSNKDPNANFQTYSDLVEHYVSLISGPAEAKHNATAFNGLEFNVPEQESAFKIRDTFSAKAEITDLNQLLAKDRIAIIGLGGTGSYVLDFIAKTPVYSIDAYDFDAFEVHNAFRSPGEVHPNDFGSPKTTVYERKYEFLRHRLKVHYRKVAAGDEELFKEITFVFVCIDDGVSRAEICDMLIGLKIPFIDVGMGIEKEKGALDGLIRTTLFIGEKAAQARNEIPTDKRDEMGAYRVYVQIAEMNALNASIAVLCYKKLRGFYCKEVEYYQNYISIGSSNWIGEP